MNIIPISDATLDIIEVLNGGVRPELQEVDTFYIWNGPDEHADIITRDELETQYQEFMALVKIAWKPA